MIIKTFAIVAGLAVTAGAASAASLVQNGSFEDVAGLAGGGTNYGSYGVYNTIPGWTRSAGSSSGIELQNNATLPTTDAQDGNWYVELDSFSNSSMYQDINFTKAGRYVLSFFYAPRTSIAGDNGIDFDMGGLVWGAIDDVFPASWREVRRGFDVATAGTLRLTFRATGLNTSYGGFVDNVSVAPVPLPASALLLMGGVAGLGGVAARRRRRLSAAA